MHWRSFFSVWMRLDFIVIALLSVTNPCVAQGECVDLSAKPPVIVNCPDQDCCSQKKNSWVVLDYHKGGTQYWGHTSYATQAAAQQGKKEDEQFELQYRAFFEIPASEGDVYRGPYCRCHASDLESSHVPEALKGLARSEVNKNARRVLVGSVSRAIIDELKLSKSARVLGGFFIAYRRVVRNLEKYDALAAVHDAGVADLDYALDEYLSSLEELSSAYSGLPAGAKQKISLNTDIFPVVQRADSNNTGMSPESVAAAIMNRRISIVDFVVAKETMRKLHAIARVRKIPLDQVKTSQLPPYAQDLIREEADRHFKLRSSRRELGDYDNVLFLLDHFGGGGGFLSYGRSKYHGYGSFYVASSMDNSKSFVFIYEAFDDGDSKRRGIVVHFEGGVATHHETVTGIDWWRERYESADFRNQVEMIPRPVLGLSY